MLWFAGETGCVVGGDAITDSSVALATTNVALLPEGVVNSSCNDRLIPFDFEPGDKSYNDSDAFWMMWFAERAFFSDRETTERELASVGFHQYERLQNFLGLQGYVAGGETVVVVAFRGSTEIQDWLANLTVPLVRGQGLGVVGKLHAGFSASLALSLRHIENTVRKFADAGQQIWVTGHSLGGAQATLLAARLARRNFKMGALYTFGAPRVGNTEFSTDATMELDRYVYRIVNERDLVPRLPPAGIAAAEAAGVFRGLFGLPNAIERFVRDLDYGHPGEMYWWPTADAVDLELQTVSGDEEDIDYWGALPGPLIAILANLEQGQRHNDLTYLCKLVALRSREATFELAEDTVTDRRIVPPGADAIE